MAASIDWRKILTGHPILEPLGKYKDRFGTINDCKSWLAARDGEIFIWNPNDASILTTNIKLTVLKKGSDIETETESSSRPGYKLHTGFQTLTLTRLPVEEVDSIVFSPSGSYLALLSKTELIIVQLPQKYGKHGLYKDGQERILCKCTSVAERQLLSVGVRLVQAEWHPGSTDDSHVTILTSDNHIRSYDIRNPSVAVETVCVCSDGSSTLPSSTLTVSRALGDMVVAFDFGPVTELDTNKQEFKTRKPPKQKMWPIYVLCGNGDIYFLHSSLQTKRASKTVVHGPLAMYPAADDNYGTDACTILCVPSTPSVIVMATLDGRIYHCVVLSSENTDRKDQAENDDESRNAPCSLYVYEELQLDLTLPVLQGHEDSYGDGYSCLIRIYPDPSQQDRYFCTHGAGLHAVKLPWISTLQTFANTEDDEEVPRLSVESQAVVEHLVCTRLDPNSASSPPLGTCVLADKLLGNVLLSLTVSCDFISLPLRSTSRGPPPALLSDQPPKEIPSPMKHLHKESFDTHIERILHRDTTQPILKTMKSSEVSSEKCLQILSQAAKVLREQYIHKLNHAREDIQKRAQLLQQNRLQQEEELRHCKDMKERLTENAENLADKYERANEHHKELVNRLEVVLKKLYTRLPMMTDAEKNMHRELKNIEEKLKIFKSSIQQLKMKEQYQSRQMEQTPAQSHTPRAHFSKSQQQQLRTLLQKEGEDIADLVQQMNKMKTSIES